MRLLHTVMVDGGKVRHLAENVPSPLRFADRLVTWCGLDARKHEIVILDADRKTLSYPVCKTCAKVRRLNDTDQIVPEPDDAAIRRAEAMGAPVAEILGRVFRVQGSTDTYTVTVPDNANLATLCNCMAGKVHPEKQCKHQVSVERFILDETARFTAMGGAE